MRKCIVGLLLLLFLSSCTTLQIDFDEVFPTDWASQICPTCSVDCPTCEPFPATAIVTNTSFVKTATPVSGYTETVVPTDITQETNQPTTTFTATTEPTSVTKTPTITFTSIPTKTFTNTPLPTNTPTVTPDGKLFQIQPNSPVYLQNFAHPAQKCNWMGVAGQIFDKSGNPAQSLIVVVEGLLEDKIIDQISLTGLASSYGPGGYEVYLTNELIASEDALYIQLFNLEGEAISNTFYFDTYADCNKNLILINFQQTSE